MTVRLVPDSPRNLKVTTPEDLALAELLAGSGAMILPFRTAAEIDAAIPAVAAHLAAGGLLGLSHRDRLRARLGGHACPRSRRSRGSRAGRRASRSCCSCPAGAWRRRGDSCSPRRPRALSDAFWPGPLTLVLRGGEGRLPDELRGREGGIAVRHTSHPGIERLVARAGQPLTSTSANRPGGPPAPGPDRLVELFQAEVEQRRAAGARRRRARQRAAFDSGGLHRLGAAAWCAKARFRAAELRRAAGRLAP